MDCLFCKIARGEIPAEMIASDDELLAFKDIHPQAPNHFLIIPKKHFSTLNDTQAEDNLLLGKMLSLAKEIAIQHHLEQEGYRLVLNVNAAGGQAVYHIHLHLLGGRQMIWPPG